MARSMRRIRLPLEKADAGRTSPVIEFVPSRTRKTDEHDYFWIGDLDGALLGTVDADALLALADEVREMQAEVRGKEVATA